MEQVAGQTKGSNHGPHLSEYVWLERSSGGITTAVLGELDKLESRVAYGEVWPTKLTGRAVDPTSDSVEFTLWLSGVVETDSDDVFSVSDDELARMRRVYGWRGDEKCNAREAVRP